MTTKEYRQTNFDGLKKDGSYFLPLIKINTTSGETKWLSVTWKELQAIKRVLITNCKDQHLITPDN